MSGSEIARSLVHFQSSAPRWPRAIQAGVAMALPIVVLSLLGYEALGLEASQGAFLVVYCLNRRSSERARILPFIALALVGSAALATSLSWSPLLLTLGLVAVGLAATVLSQGMNIGPPGPMMFVLVYGAAGHITAPVALGGAAQSGPLLVLMVAIGCALAYGLAAVPLLFRRGLPRWRSDLPARGALVRFDLPADVRTVAIRMAVAIVLSAAVGYLLGDHRAYWITATALAVLNGGSRRTTTVTRSVHRVLGTLAGALVFLGIQFWHPVPVLLGLSLGLLQFVVQIIVVRHYALALVFITPLALASATAAGTQDVVAIAGDRALDTVIGAAAALVVLGLSSRRRQDPAGRPPEPAETGG